MVNVIDTPGTSAEDVGYVVGIDIGGTFTDTVAIDTRGKVYYAATYSGKSSTTPKQIADGVLNSLGDLATDVGVPLDVLLSKTMALTHGATVGTNTILQRIGARVGLITTKGFEDTIYIQRAIGRVLGLHPSEIRHQAVVRKPEPLVPKELILGVSERVDCFGEVIIPLDEEEVRRIVRQLLDKHVDTIAICLLWSFANPVHERMVKRIVQEMAPDIPVSVSCELVPKIRENARTNTVVINAYIDKLMKAYLLDVNRRIKDLGFRYDMNCMQLFGGSANVNNVHSAFTLDSGPAGGVIAAQYIAGQLGIHNVMSGDMGGTSYDVAILPNRQISMFRHMYGAGAVVARFETLLPKVDVRSLGAGGGSIAWIDDVSRTLKLGPMSAGSEPGPACYDRGGVEPTVTDANVVLGYIDPNFFLGGKMHLYPAKSEKAVQEKIADVLGWDKVRAAWGIHTLCSNNMADLTRSMALEKGYDPQEFTLLIFGGAGSLHGIEIAKAVGVSQLIMLNVAAAFSAFGMATSDVSHLHTDSRLQVEPWDPNHINETWRNLEAQALEDMAREGFPPEQVELLHSIEARFREQTHELTLEVPRRVWTQEDCSTFREEFTKRYEEVYGEGAAYVEAPIEILSQSLKAIGKVPVPSLYEYPKGDTDASKAIKGYRDVYFDTYQRFVRTPIYDHLKLEHGNQLKGPAVIEATKTTYLILPNFEARVDKFKNLVVDMRETTASETPERSETP